ncbi:MAG TPA: isoprenylcysteine carboxylmethyltransferase family protein [Myxococcota bacterium]|nr:isoprenylcysteine carboxylmethyltransferase family protein [Myxococcota bacterium]
MKRGVVRRVLRPKIFPWYAMAAVLIWHADPTPARIGVGLLLVIAGEGLRFWSAGHLIKNQRLTVSGPYAHLRHPLYAGTMLLGVGLLWMGGGSAAPWLLGVGLLFFFLHYLPYKERIESARLERRYGEAYRRYRVAVPALLPAVRAWTDPEVARCEGWSAERVRANNEDGAALAVAVAAAVVLLQPVITAAVRRLLAP